MDYTIRVLRKCKEYGFKVYMDPHQDIWSRFCGGSGAPYWTLPACGMNPRHFNATQAAILHNEYPLAHEPDPASVPAMMWSTNYGRLATQTLFTLFFAGRDFAPKCIIDGQNIQDYLQSHYIEAYGKLADRIRDAGDLLDDCIIGWDSMNEPSEGFVGYPDLAALPDHQTSTLKKGPTPSPLQSLRLGMGQPQTVESWSFTTFGPRRDGYVTIDPKGLTIWMDPQTEPDGVHPRYGWTRDPGWRLGEDIWALHEVWDIETGYMMRPDYFKYLPIPMEDSEGPTEVSFISDYWRPHWQAWARRIRQSHPEAIHFVAPPVFAPPPPLDETDLGGRCCYSTHYYDGLTLVTRHWNWFNADALGLLRGKYRSNVQALKVGEAAIRRSLQAQLGMLKEDAVILGSYPTMVGEIGIPYDMDGRRAYGWTDNGKHRGDYSRQQRALDASLNATDGPNTLSYTLWTYCPDNVHTWGDGWNMEDLSLWSADDLRPRGHDVYPGNLADKSSALLLQQHRAAAARSRSTFRGMMTGGASQLSLATVPIVAALLNDDTHRPEIKSSTHWENMYDFLTDGARAVKAFSRPYPTAVVGTAVNLEFDINKAEFKLTVRVRADDAPIVSRPATPASTSSSAESAGKAVVPPTEVFLPLVHYAADRAVGVLLAQDEDALDPSAPRSSHEREATFRSASSETLGSTGRATPLAQALAADVTVSDGRWELDGTTLRWWYAVPQPGEPEQEHTLRVVRRGGRIWTKEEREREGVWEKMCGEGPGGGGCCIM
ncbi:glycoside hydrolase [Artomyces pyxidatus]|uniref:Glycoside hydrolase n=1 Tax=Artomyces pyxidatus TaxID=48021 RepID=A0ACB8T1X2_9AGAM|nr:glycoside hydrolase [Artomyces pyxidatus]